MRSSIFLTVPFAAAALAQTTTSAEPAGTTSSSYENPFTSYLTQTDSRGVVTGMPSVITSQPSVATALASAVTSQPVPASFISGSPGIPAPVAGVSSSISDMVAGVSSSVMNGVGAGAMSSNTTLVIVATGVSSAANSTITAVAGPNGTAIVNATTSSPTDSLSSGMSSGSSTGTPTSGGSSGSGTAGGSTASNTAGSGASAAFKAGQTVLGLGFAGTLFAAFL